MGRKTREAPREGPARLCSTDHPRPHRRASSSARRPSRRGSRARRRPASVTRATPTDNVPPRPARAGRRRLAARRARGRPSHDQAAHLHDHTGDRTARASRDVRPSIAAVPGRIRRRHDGPRSEERDVPPSPRTGTGRLTPVARRRPRPRRKAGPGPSSWDRVRRGRAPCRRRRGRPSSVPEARPCRTRESRRTPQPRRAPWPRCAGLPGTGTPRADPRPARRR